MSERLCVVMPVYNEQDAIGPVLEKWAKALDTLGMDFRIRPYNDGSKDDSLAMINTDRIKKQYRNLKGDKLNEKLHELYLAGEQNLVFQVTSEIAVKDTIFNSRPGFVVDSLAYIPFSGGDTVILASTIKKVKF